MFHPNFKKPITYACVYIFLPTIFSKSQRDVENSKLGSLYVFIHFYCGKSNDLVKKVTTS